MLSKQIWNEHPCCAFAAQADFISANPNTFRLLNKAIIDAAHHAHDGAHRTEIAKAISPREYLNQPEEVVTAVLTGSFDNGHGGHQNVPDRLDFSPYPWHTYSYWIISQLQRWNYIKTPVTYETVSQQVFLTDVARELAREVGFKPPPADFKSVRLMYDTFDPRYVDDYLAKQRRALTA